jgi:hypothetical protein
MHCNKLRERLELQTVVEVELDRQAFGKGWASDAVFLRALRADSPHHDSLESLDPIRSTTNSRDLY